MPSRRLREYVTAAVCVAATVSGFLAVGSVRASSQPDPGTVEHVLDYDYQVQETGYWCAAAAARIALSARGIEVPQAELAEFMGVTPDIGLPYIENLERALDTYTGDGYYEVKYAANHPDLRERLLWDVRYNIDRGHAVVINVIRIGGAYFPGGHYATIVGYRDGGSEYLVADPANADRAHAWIPAAEISNGIKLYRFVA
ncbi:C39 family peptidase [Stackebrandtia soli]|uniref:C39 family peptidase n=1 Tax=Stackebrandtia soli TaxID=1892856 RepID=UPI0039EB58FB